MKKSDAENSIATIITNPPTKEQAEERIKKLSEYLSEIWRNSEYIR